MNTAAKPPLTPEEKTIANLRKMTSRRNRTISISALALGALLTLYTTFLADRLANRADVTIKRLPEHRLYADLDERQLALASDVYNAATSKATFTSIFFFQAIVLAWLIGGLIIYIYSHSRQLQNLPPPSK